MIAGPLLLIGLPLIAAAVIYPLRRWSLLTATMASATSLLLGLVCLRLPLDAPSTVWRWTVQLGQPVVVLGRELALQPAGASVLGFTFLLSAAIFLLAGVIPQGHLFPPMSLAMLSMIGASILVRHPLFTVLALWLAVILAAFFIQGDRHDSVRGALRYVTMHTLAIAPFLITSWLLDLHLENPDSVAPLRTLTILLSLGFGILLAIVPFHGWITAVAKDAPPLGSALLFTVGNLAVLLLLADLVQRHPWLLEDPLLLQGLTWGGLLTLGLGGIMAWVQRDFGHLLGYGTLSDMGGMLMALGTGTELGMKAAVTLILFRAISLVVIGIGLSAIRHQRGSDAFSDMEGMARQRPLATATLILGGLSLAGLPPLAGFAGRWQLLNFFATEHTNWCWLIFLAGWGVAFGYLRGLRATLSSPPKPIEHPSSPEPLISIIVAVAAIILAATLGSNPRPILTLAARIVTALPTP